MRLLIYGAGVIGCWYAVLFSKSGYDTTNKQAGIPNNIPFKPPFM